MGETLNFPTTAQGGGVPLKTDRRGWVRCQEIFIISFDGDVLGLYDHLSEYENLDELNHLACLLKELTHRSWKRWRRLWTAASIVALCRT